MVNALEKLHRPNNRTLCFADVERRTGLIRDHLKLTGEDLQGKQVIVVDEAIFTGTTLRIVCQMLREAGAAKVHIAIPTPVSNCLRAVCPARDAVAGGQHAAVENAGLFRRGPPHLHSGTVAPGDRKALRRSLH